MSKQEFRNIAIIAHVDHGKTTLVDAMLRQSGTFADHEVAPERVMDSMDLEKERGITIAAKNTAIFYKDIKINIMDTPGHADFSGEVERSLSLVDGALLLVDASEGPLPQTRFVLKKTLEKELPVILVINKIDRPDARVEEVLNEVYDLFIDLGASESQIEFPVIYTIAKDGIAQKELEKPQKDLSVLFETIITTIPAPQADPSASMQFLVTHLAYDNFVGRIAVGRLTQGTLKLGKRYSQAKESGLVGGIAFSALYTFRGLDRQSVDEVIAGDIVAAAGVSEVTIGDSFVDTEDPKPLPRIKVDEPTVSMVFMVNNGPMAGKEGQFVTSRNLKERLEKESLNNVSIDLISSARADHFEVRGRGELQMAVLVETMRREGYELMVGKPKVIEKNEDGKRLEPMECLFLDIPEDSMGMITEKLAKRKGQMVNINNHGHGRLQVEYRIPARGLIGFRSQFLTDTKGAGVMNTLFDGYDIWQGDITSRQSGALIADRAGKVTTYAALGMEDRGDLFVPVGTEVYQGMIIGESNRGADLEVNIVREKKLTNMRASTAEATVTLRPHRQLSLEQCIEFIDDDEVVEVTPQSIRLRKLLLDPHARKRASKK